MKGSGRIPASQDNHLRFQLSSQGQSQVWKLALSYGPRAENKSAGSETNYWLEVKVKVVLMQCFPEPSAWADRAFFPRALVHEQQQGIMGKVRKFAVQCLESESVCLLQEGGAGEGIHHMSGAQGTIFTMASTAFFEGPVGKACPKPPVVNQRKAFQSYNKYLFVECLPCARHCSRY